MEDEIKRKSSEIASAMSALGRRLRTGDNSEILHWVLPSTLAVAHRPLRHHPHYGASGQPIPQEAEPLIREWVEFLQVEGVASIINLMHDRDLRCYSGVDLGGLDLLSFIESQGIEVCRLPWEDPAHSKTDPAAKRAKLEATRKKALVAYDQLPKPVVVQCSAGIDRSAPVAAFIRAHRADG